MSKKERTQLRRGGFEGKRVIFALVMGLSKVFMLSLEHLRNHEQCNVHGAVTNGRTVIFA